jgi:hypothetical protein
MSENTNTSSVRKEQSLDLVEVVAIPANQKVIVDNLSIGGEIYRAVKDKYGFKHFFVPEWYAMRLLVSAGGLRFELVSGKERFIIQQQVGLYMKEVEKPRHSLVSQGKDGMVWKPVLEE